jgi:hypothetical protein
LDWDLEWGPHSKSLEEIDIDEPYTPKALETKPEVRNDMMELIDAFRILSSRRSTNGFSANPIAFAELGWYLSVFGVPWCGTDTFIRLMIKLDQRFLEKVNKRD